MTLTITIPELVFWPMLFAAVLITWHLVSLCVMAPLIFDPLARREGEILITSRWLWPSLIISGPINLAFALAEIGHLRKRQAEGRARRDRRAARQSSKSQTSQEMA